MVSKCPELEISDDEAEKLAKASVAVAKLYDVKASEKALAWTNLVGIAGTVYVSRAIAISARLKAEKMERAGSNVHPLNRI